MPRSDGTFVNNLGCQANYNRMERKLVDILAFELTSGIMVAPRHGLHTVKDAHK